MEKNDIIKRNIDTAPYLEIAEKRLKGVWERDVAATRFKKIFYPFPGTSNRDKMWFDAGFYEGALYIKSKGKMK